MIDKDLTTALDTFVTQLTGTGEENIARLLIEFKEDLFELSNDHPALLSLKKICFFTENDLENIKDQPSYRLSLINICNNLQLSLEEEKGRLQALHEMLIASMESMVSNLVCLSKHQLSVLNTALDHLIDLIAARKDGLPIILLELPIGNSIPCRLLERRFKERKIDYEVVNISLLRNDSKSKGLTRGELITKKLGGREPALVIYMDEWASGTNFNRINRLLAKLKKLTIVPVGFLAYDSHLQTGYSRFVDDHANFALRSGISPDVIRYTFPVLDTPDLDNDFIWGEYDKLAGYTKTELAGDMFKEIYNTVRLFIRNSDLLDVLLNRLLPADQVDKEAARLHLLKECNYFINEFACHWDFALANEHSLNSITDPVILAEKAKSVAEHINGYQDCKLAIDAAIHYKFKTSITPLKAYHFEGLAPLCIPLEGKEKLLCEMFLKYAVKVV